MSKIVSIVKYNIGIDIMIARMMYFFFDFGLFSIDNVSLFLYNYLRLWICWFLRGLPVNLTILAFADTIVIESLVVLISQNVR